MFSAIRKKITSLFTKTPSTRGKYVSPAITDTLLAIHELNALVQNDIDAIEIYLALASLYRVQGDIERSLQIHARLLVRQDVPTYVQARIYAELGKDYKRAGFLDRALSAFLQAKELGYNDELFLYELIDLYGTMKEYHNASLIAKKLGDTLSEAYNIALQVDSTDNTSSHNKRLIARSLSVSPELALGWVLTLCGAIQNNSLSSFEASLIETLNSTPLPFLVLEEVLISPPFIATPMEMKKSLVDIVVSTLKEQPKDFLLSYYSGIYLLSVDEHERAMQSFLDSYSLQNDFWACHYELFSLTLPKPFPAKNCIPHILFFQETGKKIKRFSCTVCSLSLNSTFHICPRCKHIQSIRFRKTLQEQ